MKTEIALVNDMTIAEPQVQLYSREYFIAKFEAIPEEFWACDGYENEFGGKCALGFCGEEVGSFDTEADALRRLSGATNWNPAKINDGKISRYQQPTPKQRILAALRDLPPSPPAQRRTAQGTQ